MGWGASARTGIRYMVRLRAPSKITGIFDYAFANLTALSPLRRAPCAPRPWGRRWHLVPASRRRLTADVEVGGLASFEDGGNDARCKEGQRQMRLHVRARKPLACGKLPFGQLWAIGDSRQASTGAPVGGESFRLASGSQSSTCRGGAGTKEHRKDHAASLVVSRVPTILRRKCLRRK